MSHSPLAATSSCSKRTISSGKLGLLRSNKTKELRSFADTNSVEYMHDVVWCLQTGQSLATGGIVALVLGCVGLVSLTAVLVVFVHRQRKKGNYIRLQRGRKYGGVDWRGDHGNQTE